jgi:beta-xylosidase
MLRFNRFAAVIANVLVTTALAAVISLFGSKPVMGATAPAADKVWTPDNGDGTYTNPLMWGDWPDPDVIRVGDDFYFVSTSMHYVPGCPIATSKDLVNWQMAGYAIQRYDEDPRYDMIGGDNYLNGSWAATIRHHNGLFYVGFCTPHGIGPKDGQFSMCTAMRIKGPWTRTIFPEKLYDPGLLFDDDGKVYVAHGQGTIYVTELNADALSTRSPRRIVFPADPTLPYLEGSHFYKINGKYYILSTTGGGGRGGEICLRSDRVYGPYEHKLVMDSRTTSDDALHQGGMVQLKDGSWWFIIMENAGPLGRRPNLEPVTWVDGWPILGKAGKGVTTWPKPNVGRAYPITVPATTDEFDSPELGLQWQWNHNPDPVNWSLTQRPGYMRLTAGRAADLRHARNTLTQRVQGPKSIGTVEMDVRGLKDGDIAGFGVFDFPYAFVAVKQKRDSRSIVMLNDDKTIATIDNFTGQTIWFRASTTAAGFTATFACSTDGKVYQPIGDELKMKTGLTWTANRFALFNYSTTDAGVGGHADFNWFHYSP